MRQIAGILKVLPDWLATGTGPKRGLINTPLDYPDQNTEPAPKLGPTSGVPVVGTAQLGDDGYWVEVDAPVGFGDGHVRYAPRDPGAYAIRCVGDSMKPRIKNGQFVIVEPGHTPSPGDEVLVKAKDGRVMVKELLFVRDGLVHLHSVNEAFNRIRIPVAEVEHMHCVVAIANSALWEPD